MFEILLLLLFLLGRRGPYEGIASIIRESCQGRAVLIRARRGDPEPIPSQTAMPKVQRSIRRGGRLQARLTVLPKP